jgi:uroporphyrinogen-III synthase
MTQGALQNRKIALAETRELDLLAQILEKEGATVVRCPMVSIEDTSDAAGVEAWIRQLMAGRFADVIFYTGEGVRRILGFAGRAGLRDQAVAALGKTRKITRGPKPVRALREVGLEPDVAAPEPTTAGLIAAYTGENIRGRSVGLQIYGQEANRELLAFLENNGAVVHPVAPYVYASKTDDGRVEGLIRDMAAGRIAAILFTSSPQVQRICDVAERHGMEDVLKAAWTKTRVAAIGPVVAEELKRHGIHADAMPEGTYNMKPLVRAVAALFQSA